MVPIVSKKRKRLRSRHAYIDSWLQDESGNDAFADLEDFLKRVNSRVVNRKALESLIKAGALDRFGERHTLLHNLDFIVAHDSRLQKQADSGQTDLFGALVEDDSVASRLELQTTGVIIDEREQLKWERELLGLYLSSHPLERFE